MDTTPTPIQIVESLTEYDVPLEEIATHLQLPVADVEALPGFREARVRGENKRKILLRQADMKRAIKGDGAALRRLMPSPSDAIEREGARRLADYMTRRSR